MRSVWQTARRMSLHYDKVCAHLNRWYGHEFYGGMR